MNNVTTNNVIKSTARWIMAAVFLFLILFEISSPRIVSAQIAEADWSSEPIVAGETPIKRRHLLQLRAWINIKRERCGLAKKNDWSQANVLPGITPIKADDILELRDAINEIYNTDEANVVNPGIRPPISFTDDVGATYAARKNYLVADTPIRAIHFTELRNAIDNISCCGDLTCDAGIEDIANCAIDCECEYENWENLGCGASFGEHNCLGTEALLRATETSGAEGCSDQYLCAPQPEGTCCVFEDWHIPDANNPIDWYCGYQSAGDCEANAWFGTTCPSESIYSQNPCSKAELFEIRSSEEPMCNLLFDTTRCEHNEVCCRYYDNTYTLYCAAETSFENSCNDSQLFVGPTPMDEGTQCSFDLMDPDNCANGISVWPVGFIDLTDYCCYGQGNYQDIGGEECGGSSALTTCGPTDKLSRRLPFPNRDQADCPIQEVCTPNKNYCCQMGDWLEVACGEDAPDGSADCRADEMLMRKEATDPDGDGIPDEYCQPDYQCEPRVDCCGYPTEDKQPLGCGEASAYTALDCTQDMRLWARYPAQYDPDGCDYEEECIFEPECCQYQPAGTMSCGGSIPEQGIFCNPDEILFAAVPLVSDPECPIIDAECRPNESECCAYASTNLGCGQSGGGEDCAPTERLLSQTSPTCSDRHVCDTDPTCCNYPGEATYDCGFDYGAFDCNDSERLIGDVPQSPEDPNCPVVNGRCQYDAGCCNYQPWEYSVGCGGTTIGGTTCAADERIRTRDTDNPDCQIIQECVQDNDYCCNYGSVGTTCVPYPLHESGCSMDKRFSGLVANPINESGNPTNNVTPLCPMQNVVCTDAGVECCAYDENPVEDLGCVHSYPQCVGKAAERRAPGAAHPQCPEEVTCVVDPSCCEWGEPQELGCGQGGCAANEMRYLHQAPGCEAIYNCNPDRDATEGLIEVSCYSCETPGEEDFGEFDFDDGIDGACPAVRTCQSGANEGLWSDWSPVPSECTPGEWEACNEGIPGYRLCDECGFFGPCGCNEILQEPLPCDNVTLSGFEHCQFGQRTCLAGAWSQCEPRYNACYPADQLHECDSAESIDGLTGLPGLAYCDSCGENLGGCNCQDGDELKNCPIDEDSAGCRVRRVCDTNTGLFTECQAIGTDCTYGGG